MESISPNDRYAKAPEINQLKSPEKNQRSLSIDLPVLSFVDKSRCTVVSMPHRFLVLPWSTQADRSSVRSISPGNTRRLDIELTEFPSRNSVAFLCWCKLTGDELDHGTVWLRHWRTDLLRHHRRWLMKDHCMNLSTGTIRYRHTISSKDDFHLIVDIRPIVIFPIELLYCYPTFSTCIIIQSNILLNHLEKTVVVI